jgi:GT2 family glycosyltransferase
MTAPAPRAPDPAVSIVVCTRGRGPLVISAIESILASVGVRLELVVVDQSASTDTANAVAVFRDDPRLRYIRSFTVGVSRARNIGIRAARNDIVLITDDDVTVPPDWARNFLCAMAPLERVIGAGMAVRRDAVLALGGFDEQLGPGAPLRSGEDRDLAARALTAGWRVYQTPDAMVVHHGFRTWAEGRELTRRDWYGIGAAYAKQVKAGHLAVFVVLAHEVVYMGFVKPALLALRGRGSIGIRRVVYFLDGFWRGLCTPIDHRTVLFLSHGAVR